MADETTQELILRCQLASYMKCPLQDDEYYLIGEGFTTFPESKNPSEYSRKYVSDRTERSDVIGYAPSIEYSCDTITNEPCVAEVIAVTDRELLGSDTRREIVSVNTWDEVSDGEYRAYKRTYSIIPDGKGDGTDSLIYTGTMKAAGDMVEGTFNLETKTFTEGTDEATPTKASTTAAKAAKTE